MSQTTVSAPRLSGPAQQLDDYLQQQMRKASAQVRLVDLFTSIMTLLAVFLGALFLIALVDAWVLELKPWMRASALGLIIVSAIAYILIVIVPLSIRKINPVYAAKVVESARPDIKNGLINYLLLRSYNREEKSISQRVIELVGSRAANDISGVEVAGTVDKSNTIRIAMVLVTIVTVLGLYKVFSPKDPFQTFARVIAPFSDVARPARVRITEVTPGNTTVYFGQPMPVTARISGRFDEGSVFLVYSTTDGQVIDERVSMRPSDSGDGTYVTLLKTDERGIGHSLNYHIEAGDGESVEYSMTLKSTPMLSVDSITYEPPAYTRLPTQTVNGTSEISAHEGTLVTLNTVANTQLQSASVVLLNQRSDAEFDVVNTMSMTIVHSKRAECKFRLQLDNNRQGQRYSHYQLQLSTVEGKTGEPAAPCPIRVIPDLAPEIEVLEPTDTEVSVPVNSKIRFVIRSQDADFELSKISVVGNSSVYEVFNQDIPMPRDADLSGQVNVRFDLWPKKLKMREGETVMVTFSAYDNRVIAPNDLPDPNRTPSVNYMVTVTPAIENPPADKPEDEPEQGDKDKSDSAEDSNPSENQQNNSDAESDKDKEDSKNENEDANAGNDSEPNDDSSSSESDSESNDEEGKDSSPDGQPGEDSKQGENQNNKQDDNQSSDSKDSGEAGKDGNPDGGTANDSESKSADSKGGNANDGNGGNSSPEDQGNSDSKSGQPGEQGSSDSTGTQSSSDSPAAGNESSTGDAAADGSEQPGQTESGDQPGEPLGEDASAGDIIDKINQIREQQEKSGNQSSQSESGQPNQGENQDDKSGNSSSQDQAAGNQSQSGNEPESANGGSKQDDQSNSGAGKEETQQNPAQDNKPTNEGTASNSKDAGEKGSNDDSPSSGGSGDEKDDDKNGSSEGGGESGEKPEDEKPNPDEKSGGGGGDDQKQQSSGESGSQDDSGSPKQSDPSRPSGNSQGKDGESGTGEPGDSGSAESGGSQQDGAESGEEGSSSGGSPESGNGEQKGTPAGNSSGNTGDQPGSEGAGKESQQPAGSGNSPGDQPGDSPSSQSGDGQSSDGAGNSDQGSDQQGGGNAGGQPGGSATGNSKGGGSQPPPPTNSANSADAANLEYTKKATDLALDYLTQQQVNPDPELLEQLNFTEDELRDFVKRWNELRQRAETGDASDKAAYNQELRSLGIGPKKAEVQQTQVQQDKLKGYQEDGRVSNAPAGFRAFEKRRNRVDEKQSPR